MVNFSEVNDSSDEETGNDEIEMQEEVLADEIEESEMNGEDNSFPTPRVYLPSQGIDPEYTLECDESAYVFLHTFKTGSPCLSFDVIPDNLGEDRSENYPLTFSLVGGTQHEKVHCNQLIVMKVSNVHKSKARDEEDEEEESDSDSDDDPTPKLECAAMRHAGHVNRVKVTRFNDGIIASTWSDLGIVYIWDLTHQLKAVNDSRAMASYNQNQRSDSLFQFGGHPTEGYAMEWSPLIPGMLATGDCKKNIFLWKPSDTGVWLVDQRPYTAHTDSVEDIQWSPNESNVMASCSVDKSIRIWDIRAAPSKACMITQANAHDSDVNVISWNKQDPFILSGGDDGKLRVWDLRKFGSGDAICTFKHHAAPITSVEWHPTDHSVFAASGSDDQVTQWDLAAERDDEPSDNEQVGISPEVSALPAQLLFIHQGQNEIKELHWHKQIPGVLTSTASTGFNIFRTMSV